MPEAADITKARALATRRGKHLKLNMSYGHELINWEMSVYFDIIGLVLQLIEKIVLSLCGVKTRVLEPKTGRLQSSKTCVFRPFIV